MDEAFTSWLFDTLGEARAQHVLDALGEMSTPLSPANATWLRELIRSATELPLPDVPLLLSQDLRQIPQLDDPPEYWRASPAIAQDGEPAISLRGSTATDTSTSYTFGAGDVIIDLSSPSPGVHRLEGQVLFEDDDLLYRVRLTGSGSDLYTESDEFGQFEFGSVPSGAYRLVLSAGVVIIELDVQVGLSPGPR